MYSGPYAFAIQYLQIMMCWFFVEYDCEVIHRKSAYPSTHVKYLKEYAEWEAEIPGAMLVDMLLAAILRASNPGSAFIFLVADWLFPPKSRIKEKCRY